MVDIIPLLNTQRARQAFSQAGLGAFTETTLRLSTIEASTAFLKEQDLHSLGKDELIKLVRTLAHQPDRVEFGSLGGGLKRRDLNILMKLRDISYDESFSSDVRQESRAALMSIMHTIRDASVGEADKLNPEASKMAGFVEKLVLADNPVKALHAIADIIDTTEFRKQDVFLFFSRNASLEQDVSKTLDGILSGLDPTLLKFYKSVVHAELKNTFARSEQILLGQGEEEVAFRKKSGSFRLLAGLRRALSEKFETSIPEAAKKTTFPTEEARIAAEKKGYVRDEFEILQHMVEMLRHAPLGNLKAGTPAPSEYLKAKEKLLQAVNRSAEGAFILEMEIRDLEKQIKDSETKALRGEGDRSEHLSNVADIRKNQLAKKIAEHKTLLAKRATEAALIEQTWKKMESVTGARVLQETLQTELFSGLMNADRRIDTKALQTIFPLNEWGPLSDAKNFSMKEILEAHAATPLGATLKLTIPATSSKPAETVEYRKGSAQYQMIQHFANERKQHLAELQAQETELRTLESEKEALVGILSGGRLGDLVKNLFNPASSDPSKKRYEVLNRDLEVLGQSGSTHAEDLRVSLKDSAAEFNRAVETLNKLNLGARFPDSSKDSSLADAITALDAFKQGNYDRLNSSGSLSELLNHLMVLQTAVSPEGKNILDVNEVDSLKRIGNFLKDDQKRAESELLLMNRVVSFEAEQGVYSARQEWKETKRQDPSLGPVSQAHEPTGFYADAGIANYKDEVENNPFPPVGHFDVEGIQTIDPQQPLKTGRKLKLDTDVRLDSVYLDHPEKLLRLEELNDRIPKLEQNLSILRDEGKFYAGLEAKREQYFANTIQRSTEIKHDYLFMMGLADPHRVEEQIFKPLNGAMEKYFSDRGVQKEDSPLWQAFQHFIAYVITFAHNYVNQDSVSTGLIRRAA